MIYSIIYNLKVFSDEVAKQIGYELVSDGYLTMFLIYFALQLLAYAVYYVFRSLGLCTMAQRKGIANPKRAWIPFYGIYIAHKLAPDSKYIKKVNAFYILAILFAGISTAMSITIDCVYGISNLIHIISGGVPTEVTLGLNSYLLVVLDTVNYLTSIAFVIFYLFVLRNLFMSYSLKNNFMLTAFSAVGYVGSALLLYGGGSLFLAGIFIFALRNKPRIDYTAYVESRRRYYNPYNNGNNPYNNGHNPYNNGNNPYNNGNYYGNNHYGNSNGQNQPSQDPFEEFSNKGGNSQSSDSDDFFN